jgi:hypothetical protein
MVPGTYAQCSAATAKVGPATIWRDLDLRTGEKTLLNLLVYEFEVVLESQDLCRELGGDAGGDQLGREGNALTAVFINLDPRAPTHDAPGDRRIH